MSVLPQRHYRTAAASGLHSALPTTFTALMQSLLALLRIGPCWQEADNHHMASQLLHLCSTAAAAAAGTTQQWL